MIKAGFSLTFGPPASIKDKNSDNQPLISSNSDGFGEKDKN